MVAIKRVNETLIMWLIVTLQKRSAYLSSGPDTNITESGEHTKIAQLNCIS